MLSLLANALWFLASLPDAARFHKGARQLANSQQAYLLALLRANAGTAFGKTHGFGAIRTVQEFQAQLPLTTYEDYREAIAQIGAGQPHVLTQQPVTLFEPTSGSTGATKLIPYTAALQTEFQRGIAPWIVDLFYHQPHLMNGRAYWSVSPVNRQESRSAGGIPIGFEDDGAYLGQQGRLVRSVMAVPSAVKFIGDIESFRYVTLFFLLRAADLTLISVWNPTFLTLLVEPLSQWWESLATDIEKGTLTPPLLLSPAIRALFAAELRPDPHRAATIRTIFRTTRTPTDRHRALWQQLQLLSCWTEGNAAPYAHQLAALFPQAMLQGKGLIATEGFVSFPLIKQSGEALALRSHFFEFLPEGTTDSRALLAHELEQGKRYEVVITTGGGLYRYRMNDLIEIVDFYHQCPLIKFIGKREMVSDWFGEKLNERHVGEVITSVLSRHDIDFTFAMLAYDEVVGGYRLYVESEQKHSPQPLWHSIAERIEIGLQSNFHYHYCRQLGQLEAVRIFRIGGNALESYQSRCVILGQRAGDIKPTFLHRASGWTDYFQGQWIASHS